MSRIEKLSILGVRSFDNHRSETIAFGTPLTLIVGYNGSGKTTIIECLKYATTGELPPNSKVNGAFIHDPKLAQEKEVLAQVRVSFRSTDGTKMVCSRNLQLTVRKAAGVTRNTMKALEGTLLINRNGEKHTMSSRVAELNTLMPQYLGVSKAILDSVIFCHQDDSLWPLSEPAKLKQRFDEIFEALKYTKAIENIKAMQKEQKTNLIKFNEQEKFLKENKNRGIRMKKTMDKLLVEVDELREKALDLGARRDQAGRNADEAWQQRDAAGLIVGELTGKRIEQRTKEESVQSLKQNLKEMSDPDEDLQNMLEQYEERVELYQRDLEEQKTRYQELGQDVQTARGQVSAKERECGSYEAQQENHTRQLQQRERLVKETARRHNIRGFDMDVNDAQVASFMERIRKMAREQNAAFERARSETHVELQGAQKVLNQINEQKTATNSRKDNSRSTIATNDRKIGSLQQQLNSINIDEGGKVAMESAAQDTEARLKKAKSELASANWDGQAEDAETELRRLDDRKEKLDAELVEGTRQAGDSARLDFVQKELKDRQRRLETMTGAHGDSIGSLVGHSWTPKTIEADFQRTAKQSSDSVTEAERQRDGTTREKEQLDFQLNSCRKDIKSKQQALTAAADAIKRAVDCQPDEYMDVLQDIERNRDNCKTDTDSFERINQYFDACIKMAKGKNQGCLTCMRGLRNDKEVEVLVKNIEKERNKWQVGDAAKDLKEFEDSLKAAKGVSSDHETWERLKNKEIPKLQQQERELHQRREGLIGQLETEDGVVNERQAEKRDIDVMSRTVQSIAKYSGEITNFEAQIEELSAKQKDSGLSRGLEQIQDDIKRTNDEVRVMKGRLAKTVSDRDRARNLINSLELESRDIRSKLSTAEYLLKEKKSIQGQVEDLKNTNNEQREHIKSMDKEFSELGPQLSQAQAKYDDVARRGADKDRELQTETNKLINSLNQLNNANEEIDSYISRGGPKQLERGRREVEGRKNEVSRLEQEQGQIVREVKSLEDQLRNHTETKRSISDNQRYRRDLRQLQKVREEIEELEKHNAEDDKDHFEREGNKWQLERNRLAAEQATATGQLKSKDEILRQHEADYETEYKDAAKKYKEAHVHVETTKACVEDLGRYAGALDKAIMKYHSLKMEEINRIIEELWRKTYQGTDVDTILIRSEHENVKSNKSYNYRVCMVKQDAEMDMRGRCSAGQKVLASIIIRLALAEVFGVNCGLIALDEPTTNLDRDNIRALAESLSEIIKVRRAQKNFQLIVITHDEEFLRYMGCGDFADVYWRVSRNKSQKSEIERQNIAEVV